MQNRANPDNNSRNSNENNYRTSNAQWWMITGGVMVIVALGIVYSVLL
jgi:hypothetical protein